MLRAASKIISDAAHKVVDDFRVGKVEQEPAFTDRMLGRIEQAIEGSSIKGINWSAKTLTDRGRNAQENKYGADFLGVLDIDLKNYSVKKGFLAQSKLIKAGGLISKSEFERMQNQCKIMLDISPDSFVFIYSITGISVVPAIAILNSNFCKVSDFYSKKLSGFYEEHFKCFIGDHRIISPTIGTLNNIVEEYNARSALLLIAKEGDDGSNDNPLFYKSSGETKSIEDKASLGREQNNKFRIEYRHIGKGIIKPYEEPDEITLQKKRRFIKLKFRT